MPSYKLIYFDARGRGESIRMMFTLAGVPFEDVRVNYQEEWPAMKPKMPLGQLPVLDTDGKLLPQSRAINYYVAREFKLYGANNWESTMIDVIGEMLFDLMKPLETVLREQDEKKKEEDAKKYYNETAPPMLQKLEEALMKNNNGDGFFVGNAISIADVAFYTFMEYFLSKGHGTALDKYPKLKALNARFAADPRIAAYLAKRKPTEF